VFGELIGEAARRFDASPALVAAEGWVVSYRDLDRLSDGAAAGLRRRGVRQGDVVALVLPSIPEYVVAYLAAAKVGAITAGVNARLSRPEREGVLELAEPRLVLATADLAPASGEVVEVVPAARADDVLRELRTRGDAGDGATVVPDEPERPVAIIFTSGTTGAPKGALFCNRQLRAITAIDVGDRWGPGGGRSLAGTSLAHLGPMTKLAGNLRQGGAAFLTHKWRADDALRLTAAHGMTAIGGIPTQVALMLRVPHFEHYDLSSLRGIVMGGGPATPALVREARERFGVPLAVRYSCTEAAIGVGTAFTDPDEDAEVSVGRPLAGVELLLLDGDDEPVPTGEVGAVCLRSAAVMSGYWRDPEATAAAFTRHGAVRTGDLGRVDEQGRLRLAGRSKEMYVRGGYNVYPMEVEAVLAEHPAVAAVVVVPRPDDVMGEVGVAVVVPRTPGGRPPALEELRAFASGRLAAYKLPEAMCVVDVLPLTAMEKVDRRSLQHRVLVVENRPQDG
jgi:acyl-CoA synthetase (AMP-forming)/AMP-acid ligase II